MTDMIDWDAVPDDELNETFLERIEGLKEILPRGIRQHGSSLFGWGWWIAKGGLNVAKHALWVFSTSALIMAVPFAVTKELMDAEKTQVRHQQQVLLGRSS